MAELIAFIGGGQMAGSLIGGLLGAGHSPGDIVVAEPDATRGALLHREYGVTVRSRGADVTQGADALVLAVKPQVMREAIGGIALAPSTTVVSIAAGIRIDSLRHWLADTRAPIVRCMPNTPALLRAGVTGLYAPPGTPQAARDLAERILGAVGTTCWLQDEALLDAVTALSGSGPAYFFLVAEALREAGQKLGLDAGTARLLAEQTLVGAGRMAAKSGKDLSELRAGVTSKGGTTEAAVAHLESHGLRALFEGALRAAERRGRELGEALAK